MRGSSLILLFQIPECLPRIMGWDDDDNALGHTSFFFLSITKGAKLWYFCRFNHAYFSGSEKHDALDQVHSMRC